MVRRTEVSKNQIKLFDADSIEQIDYITHTDQKTTMSEVLTSQIALAGLGRAKIEKGTTENKEGKVDFIKQKVEHLVHIGDELCYVGLTIESLGSKGTLQDYDYKVFNAIENLCYDQETNEIKVTQTDIIKKMYNGARRGGREGTKVRESLERLKGTTLTFDNVREEDGEARKMFQMLAYYERKESGRKVTYNLHLDTTYWKAKTEKGVIADLAMFERFSAGIARQLVNRLNTAFAKKNVIVEPFKDLAEAVGKECNWTLEEESEKRADINRQFSLFKSRYLSLLIKEKIIQDIKRTDVMWEQHPLKSEYICKQVILRKGDAFEGVEDKHAVVADYQGLYMLMVEMGFPYSTASKLINKHLMDNKQGRTIQNLEDDINYLIWLAENGLNEIGNPVKYVNAIAKEDRKCNYESMYAFRQAILDQKDDRALTDFMRSNNENDMTKEEYTLFHFLISLKNKNGKPFDINSAKKYLRIYKTKDDVEKISKIYKRWPKKQQTVEYVTKLLQSPEGSKVRREAIPGSEHDHVVEIEITPDSIKNSRDNYEPIISDDIEIIPDEESDVIEVSELYDANEKELVSLNITRSLFISVYKNNREGNAILQNAAARYQILLLLCQQGSVGE